MKNDTELKAFLTTIDLEDQLEPRDSFFGGRTNAVKLYYKAETDEKIKYLDFTSLYPTVNKYDHYPVGNPKIITSEFLDLSSYFGIAKVTVLPPEKLPRKITLPIMQKLCCAKETVVLQMFG